jgi:hypothetical protein
MQRQPIHKQQAAARAVASLTVSMVRIMVLAAMGHVPTATGAATAALILVWVVRIASMMRQ